VARVFGSAKLVGAALLLGSLLLGGCSQVEPVPEPSAKKSVNLDSSELQRILTQFTSSEDNPKVLSDQKLRASIPLAQQWLESAKIKPSKCGVTFAQPVSGQLGTATLGAVELKDSYLMVAIFHNPDVLKKQWSAMNDLFNECSRYSVATDGKSRAYHLAAQQLNSDAEHDQSYVVTSSDGTTSQQQFVVHSVDANVLIGIQQPVTQTQTAEQIESATGIINNLLRELQHAGQVSATAPSGNN